MGVVVPDRSAIALAAAGDLAPVDARSAVEDGAMYEVASIAVMPGKGLQIRDERDVRILELMQHVLAAPITKS